METKELVGKTIKSIDINGFGVSIDFTDKTVFLYNASDGGYSNWEIYSEHEEEQ